MLGNHPFAWFITFAFFYEVFKEHFVSTNVLTSYCLLTQELTSHYVRNNYIIIYVELLQQVCFGIPSKLNNVSSIKRPDVSTLD